jgi:Ca2+-binding EF-hand superfamily protein
MTKTTLSIVLLLALALPAAAQVVPDPSPQRFEAADTNDDGRVDRTEYENFVVELVLLHDVNGDGRISREEVADTIVHDPARFDEIDRNRDQHLIYKELDAYTDSDFRMMDANGDGSIDRDEAMRHRE